MQLLLKIIISVILGFAVAIGILLLSGSAGVSDSTKEVLLWNVHLVAKLAGNGPLLGYNSQGEPIYEGTPVHVFFWFLGLISTFPIYMALSFVFVSIVTKFGNKRTGYLS